MHVNTTILLTTGIKVMRFALIMIRVDCSQGDQIGRIFFHWAIVYFGQVF
jgi:hypothetical protein